MKTKIGILLAGMFFSVTANASSVSINNASFETPVLPDGGFTLAVTDWTQSGFSSTFNPAAIHGIATDGENVATASQGGSLTQVLSESLTLNTVYTLSVDVIERFGLPFKDYSIQLLAGNTVIASDISSLNPAPGSSVTSSLSYTALAGDADLGAALSIVLSAPGTQVSFDNVNLDATVSNVPVPAAVWLFGSSLLGLIGFRKKS